MSIAIVILYCVLMILIGLKYKNKQKTLSEFVTADHGLSYWVAALSARATGESGWLILGLTGVGFATGLSGLWIMLGETLGVAVSWIFIIPRFKNESEKYDSLTVLDYFEDKLDDRKHIVRIVLSTILLIMVIIYCAAQLTATGKAFNSFYNMNIIAAELLGLFIVLLYVSFGGFRAVAVSDLIQGALMFMGLVLVPVVGIIKAGGIRQVFEKVSTSTPEILNVLPTNSTALAISFTVIGLMATGLGFLGSPQIYQRIIALNRKEDIKKGRLVAITYTLITDTCAVLTGVVGRYFFTSLSDPETVYPDLVQHLFGPLMIGVLIAVVLSAIMSTMDSLLILASTTIVRDYMQKILGRVTNDKTAVTYLRVSSSVIALAAFALAATKTRVVFWMVLFAWAGIASAFCPTLIMTLFWKGTNKYGVAIGAIGGFLTTVIWGVFWRDIIYEMFPGFVAGFVLIYLGSLATRGFCKQLNGKC